MKACNLILTILPPHAGGYVDQYIQSIGETLRNCERMLAPNGQMIIICDDITRAAMLMSYLSKYTGFKYNSFVIREDQKREEETHPGRWVDVCEYVLVYTLQDDSGLGRIMLDPVNFGGLREYFRDMQVFIGLSKKQIIAKIGQNADHCFRWGSTQWTPPTPETYEQLRSVFGIDKMQNYKNYADIRAEYETQRQQYEAQRYKHHLDANHCNIWRGYDRESMVARLIKCHTDPGDIVLGCFDADDTTAAVCARMGRTYISVHQGGD